MNDEIRGAMRIRNDTRNQLKCDRYNLVLQGRYKQEKKSVKSLIEETRAQYYHDVFKENKGNTSKLWKTIREIVPSQKTNYNTYNGSTKDKANEFNKLFANVGKNTFRKTQEIIHGKNVPHSALVQENLDGDTVFRPHPVDTETVIFNYKKS